jgi:hypothetical protein
VKILLWTWHFPNFLFPALTARPWPVVDFRGIFSTFSCPLFTASLKSVLPPFRRPTSQPNFWWIIFSTLFAWLCNCVIYLVFYWLWHKCMKKR